MKSFFRFVALLIFICVLAAGLIFSGHNRTPVVLWLGTEFAAQPLSLWIIAAFIIGGLIGLLLGLGIHQGGASRRKLKKLQRTLELTENELLVLKQHGNVAEDKVQDTKTLPYRMQ
jgi:uncharacterized integral membrane protein